MPCPMRRPSPRRAPSPSAGAFVPGAGRPNRRLLLAGGAASLALAGCGAPYPTDRAEARYPPIGEFVAAEGLRVHYWRRDPEDPDRARRLPAVLIHGASGNLRDWTFDAAPRLAEHRPVIALDRPGFGYSERPDARGWHPRVQARVLRGAVARLGVERAFVVGHSLGAAVAMAWAADAPSSVAGVVPVSGVTMPYRGVGRAIGDLGLAGVLAWAYTEYVKASFEAGGLENFLERAFRPQPIPTGYAAYVGAPLALRTSTLEANEADLRHIGAALGDLEPLYPTLGVPAEIVHGAEDFIDPSGQSLRLHAALSDARLTLLPHVGHMAHHAAPEALIAALDRLEARV
ncbi:MAG: alpha/beta fold hydrolase [Paracoccaceae bacterium]